MNYLIESSHLFQKRNNTFLKNNFYSGLVRHIRRLPAALLALTGMMNEWMNGRMDVSKRQNCGSTFPSGRQRQSLTERGTWRLLDTLGHLSHGIIIVTTLTCRRYLIVGSHAAGRPVLLIATSTLRLIYNWIPTQLILQINRLDIITRTMYSLTYHSNSVSWQEQDCRTYLQQVHTLLGFWNSSTFNHVQ